MKFTIEDLKNLSALLQTGKFTVNAQESVILVNLTNKVVKMIEEELLEEAKKPIKGTKE